MPWRTFTMFIFMVKSLIMAFYASTWHKKYVIWNDNTANTTDSSDMPDDENRYKYNGRIKLCSTRPLRWICSCSVVSSSVIATLLQLLSYIFFVTATLSQLLCYRNFFIAALLQLFSYWNLNICPIFVHYWTSADDWHIWNKNLAPNM